MNVGDAIKNSNSWHWLTVTVAVAAVASAFLPTYGWRDVFAYRDKTLAAQEKRAQDRLQETRSLCAVNCDELKRQADAAKNEAAKARAAFAAYGMEALPTGDKAVFTAQSRVGEALNKRRLRLVSTEAKVADTPSAPAAAKPAPSAPAAKKQMTAAEFRRQIEQQAASMSDPKLRDMVLADGRKKAAQMEAAERRQLARPAPSPARAAAPASAAPVRTQAEVRPDFRTETLDYKVVGDFRDIFMFFVAETYKKPNYCFKDISVSGGSSGMDLAFTLQVNHK